MGCWWTPLRRQVQDGFRGRRGVVGGEWLVAGDARGGLVGAWMRGARNESVAVSAGVAVGAGQAGRIRGVRGVPVVSFDVGGYASVKVWRRPWLRC